MPGFEPLEPSHIWGYSSAHNGTCALPSPVRPGSAGGSLWLMESEIKTIERDDLKAKLDRGDEFKLIMAMHEWGFNAAHIPVMTMPFS